MQEHSTTSMQLSVVVALVAVACVDPTEIPADSITDIWVGDAIQINTVERESNACGATFEYVDRHFARTAAALTVEPDPKPILWWITRDLLPEIGCPPNVDGCISYDRVHTLLMPHEHEVTHLVTEQFGGCHVLLNEGIAEVYRGPAPAKPSSGNETMAGLLAVVEPDYLPGDYYPLAGSFVDYLLREYDLDTVLAVCERAPLRSDLDTLDLAFSEVVGLSLDELAQLFDTEPQTSPYEYLRMPALCSDDAPLELVDGPPLELEIELDCGTTHVVGAPGDTLRYQRRVEVVDGRAYQFTFSDEQGANAEPWLRLFDCDAGFERLSYTRQPQDHGGEHYPLLPEGDYVLALLGPEGYSTKLTIVSYLTQP